MLYLLRLINYKENKKKNIFLVFIDQDCVITQIKLKTMTNLLVFSSNYFK